jgi:purine catabolism regulator
MLAGGVRLGCMVANLPGPLDAVRLAALENGGSSAALEILQRREAADADTRLRERFVSDLLARSLEPEAIGRRAAALGWEADDSYVVVLARGADPADLTAAAAGCVPRAVAVARRNACMVIASASGAPPLPSEQIAAVLSRVDRGVHVGMSSRLSSVSHLPTGLREAEEALRVAEVFDRRGRVRCHGELGALRLLADAPPEELKTFATEALAPLDSLEPGTREPLSATLSELIATGLNLAETARRGGWHYNTVRYRLRRLSEILGPFMDDGARLQTLTLALLLRRELGDRPTSDLNGSNGAVQRLAALGLGDDETIAQALRLEGYGVTPGGRADLVVLDAEISSGAESCAACARSSAICSWSAAPNG